MSCKLSTSPQALRHQADFQIKTLAAAEASQGVRICSMAGVSIVAAPADQVRQSLRTIAGNSSNFLVSCCLLHGAATQWLPIDGTTFIVADPWFVVGEEHLADEVAPAPDTGLLEHPLEMLLHSVSRDKQLVSDLCR